MINFTLNSDSNRSHKLKFPRNSKFYKNLDVKKLSMSKPRILNKKEELYRYPSTFTHYFRFLDNLNGKDYNEALDEFLKLIKRSNFNSKYLHYDPITNFHLYLSDHSYYKQYIIDDNNIIRKIKKSIEIDYSGKIKYNHKHIIKHKEAKIVGNILDKYKAPVYLGKLWIKFDNDIILMPVYNINFINSGNIKKNKQFDSNFQRCIILGITRIDYYKEGVICRYYDYETHTFKNKYGIKNVGLGELTPAVLRNQIKNIKI